MVFLYEKVRPRIKGKFAKCTDEPFGWIRRCYVLLITLMLLSYIMNDASMSNVITDPNYLIDDIIF